MQTSVKYFDENAWLIGESEFNPDWLGKYEAILSLGNGYMGVRSATEENYVSEVRNHFVAGTFNKFHDTEVTELANLPDLTQIVFRINGQRMSLIKGTHKEYSRYLNLKTGELTRSFIWITPQDEEIQFIFKRFVSKKRLHVMGQRVEIQPLNKKIDIEIVSGIDGRKTNSGSQHFTDGEKHLYNSKYLQMMPETTESNIVFALSTTHRFDKNGSAFEPKSRIEMERRKIFNRYWISLDIGEKLSLEKLSNIHTSRDKEYIDVNTEKIAQIAFEELEVVSGKGYAALATESAEAWESTVWSVLPITIHSSEFKDQLAINFAKYHLHAMTPAHDNRMNIGAKGLSGEGYKGHTFWDTEVFMLPYFIYSHPQIAKSLVEYRYLGLEGARRKAKENDCEGAQFPWEAAWIDDGETTPIWGAADIITGKATKIWSGIIEQHITSDVAFGVNQYVNASGDNAFFAEMGCEIILDAAKFWASRVEWNKAKQNYQINNVIGADEYKEHVNNNAYTNYTAYWTIGKAIEIYENLQSEKKELFDRLNKKLTLEPVYLKWKDLINKIYLPKPNEDGVIPQDDSYLSKEIIDISKYKEQDDVGGLFHEYNLEQVNNMQITKQADVMLLIFLFENYFEKDIKEKNWNYYEPKTTHDSSLSLSTHSALAADLGNIDLAYDFFKKATHIDMGTAMNSSNEGIHAASLGGIWQIIVFGFGGVRALEGNLRIDPHLPEKWGSLEYGIFWHQQELSITANHDELHIVNKTGDKEIIFECRGKKYQLKNELHINL